MPERIIYSNPVPEGMGANPGGNPVKVPAPRIGGDCFANMQSAAALDQLCASNPNAAYHNQITERIKMRARILAEKKAGIRRPRREEAFEPAPARRIVHASFSMGATVKDLKTRRKGIIIKANAGYTAKSHKPVHRISDSDGNMWYAKEKDLKLLH
jgi:hypothetical protein